MSIQSAKTDMDIYFSETADSTYASTHFHNVHRIILITDGEARIEVADKSYSVSENTLIFISNLEKHSVKILRAPYKRYVISLPQDFGYMVPNHSPLLSILVQRPESFSHAIKLDAGTVDEIRKLVTLMLAERIEQRAFWTERFMISAMELLILLYRYSSAAFPVNEVNNAVRIVSEVQQYMVRNGDQEISLDSMANRHFVSKYYLSHIFKTITGYTFKNYLILLRLSLAKDLLLHTDHSVTDVCLQAGFNNVNHFIRIFKDAEGITPYQYKKRNLHRE